MSDSKLATKLPNPRKENGQGPLKSQRVGGHVRNLACNTSQGSFPGYAHVSGLEEGSRGMPQPSSTPGYPGTGQQPHDPLPPAELGSQEARRQIAELHRIGLKYHLIPDADGLEIDEL